MICIKLKQFFQNLWIVVTATPVRVWTGARTGVVALPAIQATAKCKSILTFLPRPLRGNSPNVKVHRFPWEAVLD
jgi:hypothetical protein